MRHGRATEVLRRMREVTVQRTFNEGLFRRLRLPKNVQVVFISVPNYVVDEQNTSFDRILEITRT